jgi:hypothetical protein
LAYQDKGITDMAQTDFEKALRNSKAAQSFDLADDPLQIADGMKEGCHEATTREQNLVMMINRLRVFTGQDFGCDPNGDEQAEEQAIAAWEQWFKDSGRMQFTLDARPIPVRAAAPAGVL